MKTFELCKKLHELKPDWQTVGDYVIKFKGDDPRIYHDNVRRTCYDWAPEYTINYLLEKLPNRIVDGFDFGMLTLTTRQGAFRNGWMASYDDDAGYPIGDIWGVAETALDALLELTIEMIERGEI